MCTGATRVISGKCVPPQNGSLSMATSPGWSWARLGDFLKFALSLGVTGILLDPDPDHVVAVATIVARTRRFSAGALVGAFWGVGHTVTVTAVGIAIVGFNLALTPRVALSLEMVVAISKGGKNIPVEKALDHVWGNARASWEHALATTDDVREAFVTMLRVSGYDVASAWEPEARAPRPGARSAA